MFLTPFLTGKAKLWQAYWLIWILPGVVIAAISLYLIDNPNAKHIISLLMPLALVAELLIGIYLLFAPYIVWKCSANTSSKGWRSVARILLVLGLPLSISGAIPILIATSCAALIILLYLIAKISKNPKLVAFNDKYTFPILLVIGYFGSYVAGYIPINLDT